MDEQTRYQEAKKRVEELKGFYFHLISYILVNAVLVVINLLTSPEYLWFIWPVLGWGIGLSFMAFLYLAAFGGSPGKNVRSRSLWKRISEYELIVRRVTPFAENYLLVIKNFREDDDENFNATCLFACFNRPE